MRKMRSGREHYVNQVRLLLGVLPEIAAEEVFALKGGTAINLFYRDMPRLSARCRPDACQQLTRYSAQGHGPGLIGSLPVAILVHAKIETASDRMSARTRSWRLPRVRMSGTGFGGLEHRDRARGKVVIDSEERTSALPDSLLGKASAFPRSLNIPIACWPATEVKSLAKAWMLLEARKGRGCDDRQSQQVRVVFNAEHKPYLYGVLCTSSAGAVGKALCRIENYTGRGRGGYGTVDTATNHLSIGEVLDLPTGRSKLMLTELLPLLGSGMLPESKVADQILMIKKPSRTY